MRLAAEIALVMALEMALAVLAIAGLQRVERERTPLLVDAAIHRAAVEDGLCLPPPMPSPPSRYEPRRPMETSERTIA